MLAEFKEEEEKLKKLMMKEQEEMNAMSQAKASEIEAMIKKKEE